MVTQKVKLHNREPGKKLKVYIHPGHLHVLPSSISDRHANTIKRCVRSRKLPWVHKFHQSSTRGTQPQQNKSCFGILFK